ncbi:MAG: PKD domain-containing protein [Tepidisphaeraceae bacterium]
MCAAAAVKLTRSATARPHAAVSPVITRDERCQVESLESRVLFASGELDLTFGGTGKVTLDYLNRNDFGFAVAVQNDNKVLAAGWISSGTATGNDVAIARFNEDGSLDMTFGGGTGKVVTDLGSSFDTANSLAVQSDGRIVLAGETRTSTSSTDFALVRYNADGSLDTSFGTGGKVRTDLNTNSADRPRAMMLTPDGRIVVVGSTLAGFNSRFAAARFTTSGQLDTSFGGGDGVVIAAFANGTAEATSVAALADGSIILAGVLTDFGAEVFGSDFAAVRLLSDGTLDSAFGNAGWATVNLGGDSDIASAVVALSDGRLLLAGEFAQDDQQDIGLARLTASGQLDTSFGGGAGFVLTDVAGGMDSAATALVLGDGRIIVAGNAEVGGLSQFVVVRYHADGGLDSRFGAAGVVTFPFAAGEAFGRAVALDGDGRIVVAGHATGAAGFDFALARLLNHDNQPPTTHAGGAYVVNAGVAVQLDGSGSIDVDGSILSYDWDFDYDGSTFDIDGSGATVRFSAASLPGPVVRTVALRVTDDAGATHLVTTTVTVNAAPVASAGGAYTVVAGGSVQLDGGGSIDPDGSIVSYEWDFDYNGSSFEVDGSGATPMFSSAGATSASVRTVALRVTDNHGATHLVTTTVTISLPPPPPPAQLPGTAVLVDDPANPGRKMLVVLGTTKSEHIRLQAGKKGKVEVRLGSNRIGAFDAGFSRILIDGGAGNDVIDASDSPVPVMLFGGAGGDRLIGSRFNDVLCGGAGDDNLLGGRGDDVIIGGAGRDQLDSRRGNDLLVGGSLAFESDAASMTAVLAEWTRTDLSLAQRIDHLLNGGGHNATVSLSGDNVIEDNATDTLSGTQGADWLLAGNRDKVMKLKSR